MDEEAAEGAAGEEQGPGGAVLRAPGQGASQHAALLLFWGGLVSSTCIYRKHVLLYTCYGGRLLGHLRVSCKGDKIRQDKRREPKAAVSDNEELP